MIGNVMVLKSSEGDGVDQVARDTATSADTKAQSALDDLAAVGGLAYLDDLSTNFVLDGAAGDSSLPMVGDRSFVVRKIRLRATDSLTATVIPQLMTDGATPRRVTMHDDDGLLTATVAAGAPPVCLTPSRHNVVASDTSFGGLRLAVFNLSAVSGAGRIEVTLDFAPAHLPVPRFTTPPAHEASFSGGVLAGALDYESGNGGGNYESPEPLFGVHDCARLTIAGAGSSRGVYFDTETPDPLGELWMYTAVRLVEMNGGYTARTDLLYGLGGATGGFDRIFEVFLDEDAPKRLKATVDVQGEGTPQTLDLGPVTDFWPTYDPTATPATTDFVPILVHYRNDGVFEVWSGDLSAPPRTVSHGATAVISRARFMTGADDAATRTVDYLPPKVWTVDPGVA